MRQRTRRARVEVLTAIRELAEVTPNAAEIRRTLRERFSEPLPSERTIRDMVREGRAPAPSAGEAWSPITSDASEAMLVMPVLGAVIAQTAGKRWQLTKEQASLIAKVRAIAPDLPLWNAYVLANAYAAAARNAAPVAPLDVLVAFAPWRGATERDRYWAAAKMGAPRLPIVDAIRIVPDLYTGSEAPLRITPDAPGEWTVGGKTATPKRKSRATGRHATRLEAMEQRDPSLYRAACGCGWVGEWRQEREVVAGEMTAHGGGTSRTTAPTPTPVGKVGRGRRIRAASTRKQNAREVRRGTQRKR